MGGGFYSYTVHATVVLEVGILSRVAATARAGEVPLVPGLLDKLAGYGIRPAVDRG